MQPVFICGIGTNVGKTIFSAIFAEKIGAAYWKPVQTGEDHDSETIRNLVSNPIVQILPERFILNLPASPHFAAFEEKTHISSHDLYLPDTNLPLIIEGAGGLMVPLNFDGLTFFQLIQMWNAEVIVVSKHYLGSINHTLLTLKALEDAQIPVKGIVFNGTPVPSTEKIIQQISGVNVLLHIFQEKSFTKERIVHYSQHLIW